MNRVPTSSTRAERVVEEMPKSVKGRWGELMRSAMTILKVEGWRSGKVSVLMRSERMRQSLGEMEEDGVEDDETREMLLRDE